MDGRDGDGLGAGLGMGDTGVWVPAPDRAEGRPFAGIADGLMGCMTGVLLDG